MKKLVMVHPAYWEQAMGGAELQIFYIANFAKTQGYEVHYIYEDKNKSISKENTFIMHPLKMISHKRYFGNHFSLYHKKIYNLLKEIDPDVIYTRGAYSWSGLSAKFAKKFGKKHIWAIANDNDPIVKFSFDDIYRFFNFAEKYWIRFAIINASEIICQNLKQQNILKEFYFRSCRLVTQMAPIEKLSIEKDYEKINVLWIGNLKPIKRPEIFIRLASSLKSSNVQFIMIGKPSKKYYEIIESCSNLIYFGELSNNEINKLICKSHLLVNTSESEGFSNTFVQAWLRKVPVISMNSNPDEILTRENIGLICESELNLKNVIEGLISNISIIKDMGDRAFKYAKSNHTTDRLLPTLFKYF